MGSFSQAVAEHKKLYVFSVLESVSFLDGFFLWTVDMGSNFVYGQNFLEGSYV